MAGYLAGISRSLPIVQVSPSSTIEPPVYPPDRSRVRIDREEIDRERWCHTGRRSVGRSPDDSPPKNHH
jgi:hypothetical protein